MEYDLPTIKQYFDIAIRRGIADKGMLRGIDGYEDYRERLRELRKRKNDAIREGNRYDAKEAEEEICQVREAFDKDAERYLKHEVLDLIHEGNVSELIKMKEIQVKGKRAYTLEKSLPCVLAMELLNRDLRSCYKVQPSDRMTVLRPLRSLLIESVPFMLLRLDVKSFYESIPYDDIMGKFRDDGILSQQTMDILDYVNSRYKEMSGVSLGIPRGISCSAFLAEVYMKDVDSRIKLLPGVYFYSRYVDDIVILAAAKEGDTPQEIYGFVKGIMKEKRLTLHDEDGQGKTRLIDSRTIPDFGFDYLGYHFERLGSRVEITVAQAKMEKYENAIKEAVDEYLNSLESLPSKHSRLLTELVRKLRKMTTNYRLTGNKSDVMTGIYFKYPLLTRKNQMYELDCVLARELSRITADRLPDEACRYESKQFTREETAEYIRKRCSKHSFHKGYEERKVVGISSVRERKHDEEN